MHAIQCTLARSLGNEALWKRARLEKPILPAFQEFRAFFDRLSPIFIVRHGLQSWLRLRLFFLSLSPIRFRLCGGTKRRERQNQSKKEKGVAKHQRLQFHIPSTLQIWIRFPQNASGLKAWPFGQRNNFQKWRLADWGLYRKRLKIGRIKASTGDKKTL